MLNIKLDWSEQKWDMLWILLMSLSLFGWDVAMNQVSNFGVNHISSWFGLPMMFYVWSFFFLVVIFTSILVMRAVLNREGNMAFDLTVGIIAFLSGSFLLFGGMFQIYHIDVFKFFVWDVPTINIYHIIAIGGYIGSMFYYVITE